MGITNRDSPASAGRSPRLTLAVRRVVLSKRRRSLSQITAPKSTWSTSLVSTSRSTTTCSRPRSPLSSANNSASGRSSSREDASMRSTRPLTPRSELTQQGSLLPRRVRLPVLRFRQDLSSSNRTPRRESGSDNSRLAELPRSREFNKRWPRSSPSSPDHPSQTSECLVATFVGQLYDQSSAIG